MRPLTIQRIKETIASSDSSMELAYMLENQQAASQLRDVIEQLMNIVCKRTDPIRGAREVEAFLKLNGQFRSLRDVLGLRVPPPRFRESPFECEVPGSLQESLIEFTKSPVWKVKMWSLLATAKWIGQSREMSQLKLRKSFSDNITNLLLFVKENNEKRLDGRAIKEFARRDGQFHAIRRALGLHAPRRDIHATLGDSQLDFEEEPHLAVRYNEGWEHLVNQVQSSAGSR